MLLVKWKKQFKRIKVHLIFTTTGQGPIYSNTMMSNIMKILLKNVKLKPN